MNEVPQASELADRIQVLASFKSLKSARVNYDLQYPVGLTSGMRSSGEWFAAIEFSDKKTAFSEV